MLVTKQLTVPIDFCSMGKKIPWTINCVDTNILQNILLSKWKVSKWWQNFSFCVNCPFKFNWTAQDESHHFKLQFHQLLTSELIVGLLWNVYTELQSAWNENSPHLFSICTWLIVLRTIHLCIYVFLALLCLIKITYTRMYVTIRKKRYVATFVLSQGFT